MLSGLNNVKTQERFRLGRDSWQNVKVQLGLSLVGVLTPASFQFRLNLSKGNELPKNLLFSPPYLKNGIKI
jgi:hypothetical protein